MPELMLFCPATKVVLDQQENNLYLLGVLEEVQAPEPSEEHGDSEPVAAIPWSIVTLLRGAPEDMGRAFDHKVEVEIPGKESRVVSESRFVLNTLNHRLLTSGFGLPIQATGDLVFVCSIRAAVSGEQDKPWEVKARYPVRINHVSDQT